MIERLARFILSMMVASLVTRSSYAQKQPPPDAEASAKAETDSEVQRVLLLVEDTEIGIVKRLRAELNTLGFRLSTSVVARQAPSRQRLEQAARNANAVAALLVTASQKGVEVWISDRVTGKTVLREVVTSKADSTQEREALIALRVVELLRASLIEVATSLPPRGDVPASKSIEAIANKTIQKKPPTPTPTPISTAPPTMRRSPKVLLNRAIARASQRRDRLTTTAPRRSATARRRLPNQAARPGVVPFRGAARMRPIEQPFPNRPLIPSPPPSVWFGGAIGIGWAGGPYPTAHAELHLRGRLHRWFSLEGALMAPLHPLQLNATEGSANLLASHVALDFDINLLPIQSSLDLRIGGGIAASWLNIESEATAGFSSQNDNLFFSWPHLHLAASWSPVESLRLVLAGRVGATIPQPILRFAGRDELRYGAPIMLWSLGADIGL